MKKTKKQRDLESSIQHRSNTVDFKIDKEKRTLTFPYGSEEPVNRGYLGYEILNFTEDSVDQSRLMASAPLLYNHNSDDVLGVVEKSWVENKRGYVTVRLGKHERGEEVLGLINDGILRNVSVGYSVMETEKEERRKDDKDDKEYYRVTQFQPAEISIVTVPADYSGAGIGRSKEATKDNKKEENKVTMEEYATSATLEEQRTNAVADNSVPQSNPISKKIMATSTPETNDVVRDLEKARNDAQSTERKRIREITSFCNKMQLGDETLNNLIDNPKATINDARAIYCDKAEMQPVESIQTKADIPEKELSEISLVAGARAALTGDWSSREAGLVREVSQEVELKGGKRTTSNSFLVPFDAFVPQKRATYVTSTNNVGGFLVPQDYRPQDFIEFLYNTSIALGAGVQTLNDLQGDVVIPKRAGKGSTYWLSTETTAITAGNSTFSQVTMVPKNVASLEKYSRQQVLQGLPAIEQLIRSDMTTNLQLAMDSAILNGSGSSGQPTGILNTSGVNSVAMGTNGGAITLDALINLEGNVVIDNGIVNPATTGYLTNGKVVNDLKKLKDTAGQYLYNIGSVVGGRGATPANINGYTIADSMQLPSTLTKGSSSGNCSAVIFGDFSQCLVGLWGGLEITVGEDSDDFSKALTSIRGIMTMDVAVRNPVSFGVIKDVTTTL